MRSTTIETTAYRAVLLYDGGVHDCKIDFALGVRFLTKDSRLQRRWKNGDFLRIRFETPRTRRVDLFVYFRDRKRLKWQQASQTPRSDRILKRKFRRCSLTSFANSWPRSSCRSDDSSVNANLLSVESHHKIEAIQLRFFATESSNRTTSQTDIDWTTTDMYTAQRDCYCVLCAVC